jgi:hypothetical protein
MQGVAGGQLQLLGPGRLRQPSGVGGERLEPQGWKPAGTLVPLAYIGWSLWLLALGIGLLVTT